MMYSKAIEKYLNRKVDFRKEILLQDDGQGVYIKIWDVIKNKPTMAELDIIISDNELIWEKENKINEVKKKAQEIILKEYPYWKQNNLSHRAIELSDKKYTNELTQEELDEEMELNSVWVWVKNMRTQSDVMESMIENLETVQTVKNYEINFEV